MQIVKLDSHVRIGVLLTVFALATLLLVMTQASPALATGSTDLSFQDDSYEFSVDENTAAGTVVGTVIAADSDEDPLTYSVGGTDAVVFEEMFAVNTSTGEITVKSGATINYESGKTTYRINVQVTDGKDDSGTEQAEPTTDAIVPVAIRIVNIDEPGTATLSTTSPQVGVELSATLSDPDGRRGGIYKSWWSRANNASGPFFTTPEDFRESFRSRRYTPKEADQYKYIKFTVYYFDRTCARVYSTSTGNPDRCAKVAEVVSENRVADEDGQIVVQQVANTPATGDVQVTGGLQVGNKLTGDVNNIEDANGIQSLRNGLSLLTWRWFRVDPTTGEETHVDSWVHGGTYWWVRKIHSDDRGKALQARVSFRDDYGNWETLRSPLISIPAPLNTVATGRPVVMGDPQVGERLSVDVSAIADADGITTRSLTYLWFANDGTKDVSVAEETIGSTYTPGPDDVGKNVMVQAVFTDAFGYTEVLTSVPTAPVTEEGKEKGAPRTQARGEGNSAATGAPTITGKANVGQTLAADTSAISDAEGTDNAIFSYQWLADDIDIKDSTSSSYKILDVDLGKAITVKVTFNDDAGHPESLTSEATTAVEPSLLTASIQNVPSSYYYGRPEFTFELHFSEEFTVSYRTLKDSAFTVTGGKILNARRLDPPNNIQWEISVKPQVDTGVSFHLPVTTDCASQGAICTGEGKKLSEALDFTVAGPVDPPDPQENSPASRVPTISGTVRVLETLTAATTDISDADGIFFATFSYQWLADGTEISGATSSTYTLAETDEGKRIRVRVSFTDSADNLESLTSAETVAVMAKANSPATGSPGISGILSTGETLTVDTSGISDADGMSNPTFGYQWIRHDKATHTDADIIGATGSTYTVTADDEGKGIRVRVSFTDDENNIESRTSHTLMAAPVPDVPGEIIELDDEEPPPLTASVANYPSSHDGGSTFTFELSFSENFPLSYKTLLKPAAFTVTGGHLVSVRRMDPPKNIKWRIYIRPSVNTGVTINMPFTTDCASEGAICTEDGRMLSTALEVTIPGPID